jgi:hypothetical protein
MRSALPVYPRLRRLLVFATAVGSLTASCCPTTADDNRSGWGAARYAPQAHYGHGYPPAPDGYVRPPGGHARPPGHAPPPAAQPPPYGTSPYSTSPYSTTRALPPPATPASAAAIAPYQRSPHYNQRSPYANSPLYRATNPGSALATPCDEGCNGHRCDPATNRCIFPCRSNNDCEKGYSCEPMGPRSAAICVWP